MPQAIPLDDKTAEALRTALGLDAFYPVLTAEKAGRLFPNSAYQAYRREEAVVRQDEGSQDIYLIGEGRVKVLQRVAGQIGQIATLGPGEMFGEMAILRAGKRSASVVALEAAKIYRLSVADLKRIMSMDDKLSKHLTELAERRLIGG